MSDPADTGQGNPLSSSTSHASGTSARSVTGQSEPAAPMAEHAATPAPQPDGGVAPASETSFQEGDFSPERQAESAVQSVSDWADEPHTHAQPETAHDVASAQPDVDPEPEYSFSPAEAVQEAELLGEAQPFTSEPDGAADDAPGFTEDEPAEAFAEDEPVTASDEPEQASEPAEPTLRVVPDAPLPVSARPEDTSELRALARQTIAENEARQQTALASIEQVSRRFTLALEEAGIDAARVSFKVMEFAQASLKNNLELAKAYATARSVPDIFGLHAAYLTRQFELLNAQAEELREIAAKMTLRGTASLKPHAEPVATTVDH